MATIPRPKFIVQRRPLCSLAQLSDSLQQIPILTFLNDIIHRHLLVHWNRKRMIGQQVIDDLNQRDQREGIERYIVPLRQ